MISLSQFFQYVLAVKQHLKDLMSTCSGLNLVQSMFSCLSALTNPDVDLSCAKFSSSLVDIKLCHKPVKASFSQSEEDSYR